MNGLADKRVFISGGCGDIGRAVAARFLTAGAKVVLGDVLQSEEGVRVAEALHSSHALYTPCDVTSASSVENSFRIAEEEWKGIDVAVCCAGTVANEPFLQITEAHWERTLNVNLTGSLRVAQAAARLMMKNAPDERKRRGAVIFTGSWVQSMPWPEGGSYCASKAGQEMLMKVMAQELAPHGITCNVVAPGIVYAGLSRAIYDSDAVFRQRANQTIPLGRLCSAEEVAGAFLYLASIDGTYVTGTTIVVDGGASLVRRDLSSH
ncbi:MAG: SDR family oxidoreductase [Pedosphaera sp.]|nr:SDR family oxidoreductase [Pedosphaera sp.]